MKLLLGTALVCARQQVHATSALVMCTDRQASTAQHSTAEQAYWFTCIASMDAEARGDWGSATREG